MFSNSSRRMQDDSNPIRVRGRNYSLGWGTVSSSVAPYVPTPKRIVKKMLDLAGAGIEDVVYDLGCGDGRILFTAVEEFEVKKAVGYELNHTMCMSTQSLVESKGLFGRIEVINENLFHADLSKASLITLYLTTSGNSKLRPKFEKELDVGTRIVSHDFPIQGWTTMKRGAPDHYAFGSHRIYLYQAPDSYDKRREASRNSKGGRWRKIREIFQSFEDRC